MTMETITLGIRVLALAYLMGVAGTLWDWHEHFVGVNSMAPHVVIDVGGLLAVGVLGFSGGKKIGRTVLIGLSVLVVLVGAITVGPFVLMMTAPHSQLMAVFMSWAMTRGALSLELPAVLLASWAAWRWLRLAPASAWRIAAALGVVVVAVASVWDLYWHQTHPLEMGASMNMMALPPHQFILAGFVIGVIGSGVGIILSARASRPTITVA
jgi:hypothetical protein